MTKTLNQIIFFSSTKIRIFFSATLGIKIFFVEKNHNPPPPPPPPPPFNLNGRSLTCSRETDKEKTFLDVGNTIIKKKKKKKKKNEDWNYTI